jgi:prepilin-type N-terminal cleavage/methylation domain-containing protein
MPPLPRAAIRRGFTLPELLITVTVVGIVMALTIPNLRLDQKQVDAAVRQVGMGMLAAQREAVARQHNVLVVFDTAARTLVTVWDANNNARIDAGEHTRVFPLPERLLLQRPTGVAAVPGDTTGVAQMTGIARGPSLVMQRSGSASRGVTLYLTMPASLGAARKDVRAFRVQRATGQVTWYAWTGSAWRRG